METCETAVDQNQNDTFHTNLSFEKPFSSLTVDDVYEIAKVLGLDLEKLIDSYGKASVEGLVSRIVKVLELLESFAARNQAQKCKEEELLKAFESLQLQQKKRHVKDCAETNITCDSRVRARKHGRCVTFLHTSEARSDALKRDVSIKGMKINTYIVTHAYIYYKRL